jgi:hypothetical protein
MSERHLKARKQVLVAGPIRLEPLGTTIQIPFSEKMLRAIDTFISEHPTLSEEPLSVARGKVICHELAQCLRVWIYTHEPELLGDLHFSPYA